MRKIIYVLLLFISFAGCDKDAQQPHETLPIRTIPVADLPVIKEDAGSEDDPGARLEYEKLRYKDPKTNIIPPGIRAQELKFARSMPNSRGYSIKSKTGKTYAVNLNFTSAGPVNVGGRSRALAIDMNNSNTIFAGGVSGGLWRSTNQGASWNRVSGIDQLPNIRSIIQDPRSGKQDIWYYGTGEVEPGNSAATPGAPYRGNGIYKSTNNGVSWNPVNTIDDIENLTSPLNYVHSLVIDPSNLSGTEMYAACIGGILRSTNGFQTYQVVLGKDTGSLNDYSTWTEVAVTSDGVVYATLSSASGSAETGIFRSTTGTTGSWENITPPEGFDGTFRRTVIGISPSNENIVFFLGNKGPDLGNSLHRYDSSVPEAQRWSDLTEFIPHKSGERGDFDAQGSYNMLIAVHPSDENIVYIGGTNLYRSTNGFSDDTATDWIGGYARNSNGDNYYNHHPDQHSLAFFPDNPDRMLSSHDGGISITENNRETTESDVTENGNVTQTVLVSWEPLNNGYITSQFYSVAMETENVGDPSLLGGLQDNSTYLIQNDDRQSDWLNIGAGDGGFCYYDLQSLILSAQFSNLFRYALIDDSFQFFNISPPDAGDDTQNLFINPFLIDPVSSNKIFVGGRGKLYYTLDVRQNPSEEEWFTFGEDVLPDDERISALGASVEPQSVLYIATETGRIFRTDNSTRLTSLTEVTGTNFPNGGYPSSIAVDPSDADKVVITFSNYNIQSIYYTTNGGNSWTPVGGNLENSGVTSTGAPSVRWLKILPNGTSPIYLAATSVGLFSTDNLSGSSTVWSSEGASTIGTVPIDMIEVRPIDGKVVVATHGNGVYEASADVPFYANLQLLDILCEAGDFTLQSNIQLIGTESDYDLNYEWFVNGASQGASLNSPAITGSTEGTFQVKVTNQITGESALSNEVSVSFGEANVTWCDNPITANDPVIDEEVSVYPNPTTGSVTLAIPPGKYEKAIVYRMNGQIIYTKDLSDSEWTFNLNEYPSGLYILELRDGNKRLTRKIIKSEK